MHEFDREETRVAHVEERNSLFTSKERDNFRRDENALVAQAKHGAINKLLEFWQKKRELFKRRANLRSPYQPAI